MNKFQSFIKKLDKLDFHYEKASMYSDRYKENDALYKDILDEIREADHDIKWKLCLAYTAYADAAGAMAINWKDFFNPPGRPEAEKVDCTIPWSEYIASKSK